MGEQIQMNRYTFSREMEYTATAFLKQTVEGESPEDAYNQLEEDMWEFDGEPSLDEEAGEQISPDEIVQVNSLYLWENAAESEIQEARRWNETNLDNG